MAAPILLCDTTGMSNDRWLECRMHGPKGNIPYTIGGSDVAAIFGVSPWTTPLELWMIKKGKMKPPKKANADQLQMGHLLEPIAAYWYAHKRIELKLNLLPPSWAYVLARLEELKLLKEKEERGCHNDSSVSVLFDTNAQILATEKPLQRNDFSSGCQNVADVPISVSRPFSSSNGMEYRWER